MEPPPAPPLAAATPPHLAYPDSLNSSPRSRNSWDDSVYPPISKLRLMCSYGGHIIPRPHDKSLSYIGGETRIVVIDRHTTLSKLTHRLSKTLQFHNTQSFVLKYQLPSEDLDSLISVTTDEDLENMIDEYDRLTKNNNNNSSSRLRLFLFPLKPDSVSSIGSLIDNSTKSKSEDWFLNALNGATSGFSDSSSVNCLLGLDYLNSSFKDGARDMRSMPDSLMVETMSFSGSASSSPSVGNLPAIGVSSEDQKVGIEEQFAQMNVVANVVEQKQNGGGSVGMNTDPAVSGKVIGDYQNRVSSGDERSEQGMVMGNRKPLQVQLQQYTQSVPQQLQQQKQTSAFDLPSPDSVSSDGIITNPLSRQKPTVYQEPIVQIQSAQSRSSTSHVEPNITDSNTRIQMQQLQDYGYFLPTQFDPQLHHQQQFIDTGTQYIPNHSIPMASNYYPMYPQNQHQYPVYYMPTKQPQPYSESTPAPKPEMASALYRTATTGAPSLVPVPSSQQQPQYVGFSQMHYQPQSIAPSSTGNPNYTYEFAESTQAHSYYTQALVPQFPAHLPVENMKQQVRTSQP